MVAIGLHITCPGKTAREHHRRWGVACRRSQLEEHGSGFAVAAEDPVRPDPALLPYAWGVDPVDMGVGGSIPFTSDFAAQFSDGAIIVTGEGPDARAHGANESLPSASSRGSARPEALFLARLVLSAADGCAVSGPAPRMEE